MTYTLSTCAYRNYRPDMGIAVRISMGIPKYPVKGLDPTITIRELTPRGDYFRASHAEFDRRFYAQLQEAGVEGLTAEFERVASLSPETEPNLVLLCFEALPVQDGLSMADQLAAEAEMCHRRMFARWWFENTGEYIPDMSPRKGKVAPAAAPALFDVDWS